MSMQVKPDRMLLSRNVSALRLQLMAAEYMKRMGERIAAAREAKGWSQGQLARAVEELRRQDNPDAANIDPSSISRYEKGKVEPNAKMKDYLAKALDQPVVYFMTPEPDKSTTPDLSLVKPDDDRLARIEERLDQLEIAVDHQNANLARQSEILERIESREERQSNILARIETLVGVLGDAEVIALAEAAADDDGVEQALVAARQRLLATDPPARSKPRRTGSGSG